MKDEHDSKLMHEAARFLGRVLRENRARDGILIPLDGNKRPVVRKWTKGSIPLSRVLTGLSAPDAMLGLLMGEASGLTVVDIDLKDEPNTDLHQGIVSDFVNRFGDTPFRVRTPSGGLHLYYRHDGERSIDLRSQGLPGEVRSNGMQVVIPPSRRPDGTAYRWEGFEGNAVAGWMHLLENASTLPLLKEGAMRRKPTCPSVTLPNARGVPVRYDFPTETPPSRNELMFDRVSRHALNGLDEDAVREVAKEIALDLSSRFPKDHPVTEAEALGTAESILRYRREGTLGVRGIGGETTVSRLVLQSSIPTRTLRLWLLLDAIHGGRPGRPFTIAGAAMARSGVIPGWGEKAYYKACLHLVELGILRFHHRSTPGRGDPSLYVLVSRPMNSLPSGLSEKVTEEIHHEALHDPEDMAA